jgi:hypothetical protein
MRSRVACVALIAALALCIGEAAACGMLDDAPDMASVRNQANAYRDEVNRYADAVTAVGRLIPFVCLARGATSAECVSLQRGYDVARKGIDATRAAIDVYDDTAQGAAAVDYAVSQLRASTDAFLADVQAVVEAVYEVGRQADRTGRDATGAGAEQATAPAEGEAAPGAADAGR